MAQNYITNFILNENSIFSFNKNISPYIATVILALISLLILYLGIIKEIGLVILGIIVGSALFYFFIKYPRFWIYTITFSLFIFFRQSDVGVSVFDIITGSLYIGTLYPWLVWQIAFKRTKLVENTGDWILLAFYILLIGNSIISVINGVDILDWIREYSITSLVLFYFPIKQYFSEEKYLKRLLLLLAIVCVITDFEQFYDYYNIGMSNVVYVYQVLISARINQPLFATSAAIGILFILYEKKFSRQLLYIIFTLINVLALISSFARTFWIILLIEIIIFLIIMPRRKKIKIAIYSLIFLGTITFTIMLAFKGNTFIILKAFENRLTSSTAGRKDPSVQARLYEYEVVLKNIAEYPLGGSGFYDTFKFFNPILHMTTNTTTTHNGYFFLFYRLGIPLSLFYIFFLVYFTMKSFINYFRCQDNLYKIISLAAFCGLFVMVISDFSSTQFDVRDGVFVLAFSFAFTSIAEKNSLKLKK
ncbi:MAG: O-antigen ligase family protein [Ignavibacteriae bacterium]|nr:O-antigen ligase family protein [Ignavibacteriota bacterium]